MKLEKLNNCKTLEEALRETELALGKTLSCEELNEIEINWKEAREICKIEKKIYTVTFHEDFSGWIDVEAESKKDARRKVREMLSSDGILVDTDYIYDKYARISNVELDSWEEIPK